MEMDKLGVVTTFIHNIVVYNIPLLYGTVGRSWWRSPAA